VTAVNRAGFKSSARGGEHNLFHQRRHCQPCMVSRSGLSGQFGRTVQTMRGPKDGTGVAEAIHVQHGLVLTQAQGEHNESALPVIADLARTFRRSQMGPTPDTRTAANFTVIRSPRRRG
jgi:hypothetical protein